MRIVALSGSLRGGSYNTSLLQALAARVSPSDEWQLLEPSLLEQVPPFNEDTEAGTASHPAIVAIRDALHHADAVVIATPEYNGSMPGQLKNVLDWMSRPFDTNPLRNKPVAVTSASNGQFGAVWANDAVRKVVGTMGGRVMPSQVAAAMAQMQFAADGELRSEALGRQLDELAAAISAAVPARVGAAVTP